MDEAKRRRPFKRRDGGGQSPLRSFALGSIVGAAGTIATVRRLRRARPVSGLAAFEEAPCFLESAAGESTRERPPSE